MSDTDPVAMVTPQDEEFLIAARCPTCGAGSSLPHFDREIGAIQEQLAEFHRLLDQAEARHLAWRETNPMVT